MKAITNPGQPAFDVPSDPRFVVHCTGATVFEAIGETVPSTARMGVAEQMARRALARANAPEPRQAGTRPTFVWSTALAR